MTAVPSAWPVASSLVFRLVRFLAVLAIASIGVTGVVVAATPEITRIMRAHDEVPLPVPDIVAQPRRSIVYDSSGFNITDVFKVENREPFKLDRVPEPVVGGHPGGRGRRLLEAQRGQRAQRHAGAAGQRRVRVGGAGRLHDHPAGRQEPHHEPDRRTHHADQGGRGCRRAAPREEDGEAVRPRAVPEHRVLRQQRVRAPVRGRGLLRQERRAADDDRGGVPRWSHPQPHRLRPLRPPRASAVPLPPIARSPGRGPAASRRRKPRSTPPSSSCRRLRNGHRSSPSPAPTSPRRSRTTCSTAPPSSGTRYQDRYNTLFRGGLRIYTTENLFLEQFARGRPEPDPVRRTPRASTPRS